MSSIAQELDLTLKTLDESSASSLVNSVREAMRRVRDTTGDQGTKPLTEMSRWAQRLAERGAKFSTGKQGAPMQAVMDDIRD